MNCDDDHDPFLKGTEREFLFPCMKHKNVQNMKQNKNDWGWGSYMSNKCVG